MLLQRNRGRSDRDAAEGDCPVRSSAETKAGVPRVSVFSRFPPACLGFRSFPLSSPASGCRLPAFVARTGSHRVAPGRTAHAVAGLRFPALGKAVPPAIALRGRAAISELRLFAGSFPAAVSGALCRIAYHPVIEGGGEPGNGPSPSFDRLRRSDYSSSRISRILIAAVAIGVPGPKMAAAPSR